MLQCDLTFILPSAPPQDITSKGSEVMALVSFSLERGGKHDDFRQTVQLVPTMSKSFLHNSLLQGRKGGTYKGKLFQP